MIKYGIDEEESDIRAHVSLPGKCITVFRTADMRALLERNSYPTRMAGQKGVDGFTSKGHVVPITDVNPKYILTSKFYQWDKWDHDAMSCGEKGDMAVDCVRAAIIANKFPLWVCGIVNDQVEIDIEGTDILVSSRRRIQVKYDWLAYPKPGGSGKLYIQTHECNPLRLYNSAS